jgi:hypothetical protein
MLPYSVTAWAVAAAQNAASKTDDIPIRREFLPIITSSNSLNGSGGEGNILKGNTVEG